MGRKQYRLLLTLLGMTKRSDLAQSNSLQNDPTQTTPLFRQFDLPWLSSRVVVGAGEPRGLLGDENEVVGRIIMSPNHMRR